MTPCMFYVQAVWDTDARVYYADSNIEGLYIEAATLEDFEAVFLEVCGDLLRTNHAPLPDPTLPPVVFYRGERRHLAA